MLLLLLLFSEIEKLFFTINFCKWFMQVEFTDRFEGLPWSILDFCVTLCNIVFHLISRRRLDK